MSIPVIADVKVLNKWTSDSQGSDGQTRTYFNLKVANTSTYDSQVIGVPKEVYDSVVEGEEVRLSGSIGGLKDKYWKFDNVGHKK